MTSRVFEPCPGCPASFLPHAGPTHPYIGAHPGCWALYSAVLATGSAPVAMLDASRPERYPTATAAASRSDLTALLVDAYAAQHHGVPSPPAIQSVAVHLLTLHGVLTRGLPVDRALWIRRRALRIRGVFRWLEPPPRASALALRDLWVEADPPLPLTGYVVSVHDAWRALHEDVLAAWYSQFVDADRPASAAP